MAYYRRCFYTVFLFIPLGTKGLQYSPQEKVTVVEKEIGGGVRGANVRFVYYIIVNESIQLIFYFLSRRVSPA
jgi:hypothetical protein